VIHVLDPADTSRAISHQAGKAVMMYRFTVFQWSGTGSVTFLAGSGVGRLVRPSESRVFQVRGRVFSSLDTIRVIGNNTTKYSSAPTTIGVAFTNWDCRS
jgi:hypothetical protein